MGRVFPRYSVVVQEGISSDDNCIYTCEEQPTYSAVRVPAGDHEVTFRFVNFTPRNGYRRNMPVSIPIERIVAIVDETQKGNSSV